MMIGGGIVCVQFIYINYGSVYVFVWCRDYNMIFKFIVVDVGVLLSGGGIFFGVFILFMVVLSVQL